MFHYTCLNAISRVGLDRFNNLYVQTSNLADADAVLVRSAVMHDMQIPQNVLAVARAGAGVNNIPLADYASRGIVVFNTPGANANGVKELVFAGMLLAARDITGGIRWVSENAQDPQIAKDAEKEKKQFAGSELSGKKLGIIGLGAIGVQVANTATHFGMEVYGYDPYISVDAAWSLSRSIRHINDVNEIYRECDYITIHVPLNDSTRGMIGEDAISLMKPGAVVLNLARDVLVNEDAILRALDGGRLRKYVSDFPNPVTAGHRNVIVMPHIGASTSESEDNCARMAVEELKEYLENGNIRNSVNFPSCDMGVCVHACRLTICHANIKKMISRFTDVLADVNIENMFNANRGEIAYTMLDLADHPDNETLDKIRRMEGVSRVRVVK